MICTSYISIACSTQVGNETSVASTLTDSERGEGGGEEEGGGEGGGGGGGGSDEHELAEKPNEDTEKKEEWAAIHYTHSWCREHLLLSNLRTVFRVLWDILSAIVSFVVGKESGVLLLCSIGLEPPNGAKHQHSSNP